MDTYAASHQDGLRRALSLALPVGTQLGSVGLESIGRATGLAAGLATWSLTSAVRTAGAGAAFVNRNVLSPLSSFAFGSGAASTSTVRYCTQSCPQLVPQEKGRRYHPSRTEVRLKRASSGLRTGSAKCSIRRQAQHQEQAPFLIAHLAAAPHSLSSESMHDTEDHHTPVYSMAGSGGEVAQWTVTTLGLQSSML